MEIRGERECKRCGTRWSYYETGSVACPECGSVRSVGVDERATHTDAGGELDLREARAAAGDGNLREAAEHATEAAREYVRSRGFVHGGDLLDLDDTYLLARELRHAASEVERGLDLDEAQERHFLSLLRYADEGDRPDPADVPESMRAARGLAYATAVEAYLDDLRTWLEEADDAPEDGPAIGTGAVNDRTGSTDEGHGDAGRTLENLRSHVKRVQALDGDVPPGDAELLVAAANDFAAHFRSGDDDDLSRARERLADLS